jgi:formate hydrogenlyase transcriptional activator
MQRSTLRIMSGNNQSSKKILPLRRSGEKICGATDTFQDVRLQFEQLLSDLSVKFINVNGQEVEREISAALDRVRDLFRFDRFGLLTFTDDKHELAITHSSYGKGISRVPGNVDVSSLYPWAKRRLLRGETIYFKSLDDLPEEAAVDRQTWQSRGVRANLTIPIHVACSVVYLIAASQVHPGKGINEDIIPRLRLMGEIFVNALVRCKAEEENRKAFDEIQKLKEKLLLEAECLKSEIVCYQRHEKIIGKIAGACGTGCADQFDGAHLRRHRHRQGTDSQGDP